jgi:hypothetical protein
MMPGALQGFRARPDHTVPRRIDDLGALDAALLLVEGGYRLYDAETRRGRLRIVQRELWAQYGDVVMRFCPRNLRPDTVGSEGERRNWLFRVDLDGKPMQLWSEYGPVPNLSGRTTYETRWKTDSRNVTAEELFANPDVQKALRDLYREFVRTIHEGGLGLPGREFPED